MADPKEESKSPIESQSTFVSKTIWSNMILAAAVEVFPRVSQFVSTHPQTAILACAAMNVILRHFTNKPIQYFKS